MPVQITINGENANQAIEEFATLSAAFSGQASVPSMAKQEEIKPSRQQRKTSESKKEEPKTSVGDGEKMNADAISKDVEEEAEEFLNSAQVDVEIPSVVDLRAKAQEVGKDPAKRKAVKTLLDKFNSPSITDVPEDKRIEFMAELENL